MALVCCPREDRKGEGDVPRPDDDVPRPVPAGVAGREKAEGRADEERPDESPPVWPAPVAPPSPLLLRKPEEKADPLPRELPLV